jgi:SMI1 / KNR4 family (SUKH-1)
MMIDLIVQKMIEEKIVIESELVGCSEDEIKQLEIKYKIQLPQSYKEFLRIMGKNASRLVDRHEFAIEYDSVMAMTAAHRQLIDRCKLELEQLGLGEEILELPHNALLILCRLPTHEYYLIEANGGEDSPVFYYGDDDEIVKEFDSFGDVLDMFVKGRKLSNI